MSQPDPFLSSCTKCDRPIYWDEDRDEWVHDETDSGACP